MGSGEMFLPFTLVNILPGGAHSVNWLFTVKQLTSTSSWKGSPHHDTSSSMLNCGRDAFTIVFPTRSSNTHSLEVSMPLKSWFITPHNSVDHSESNFPYSANNLILSHVFLRQQWLFRHKTCIGYLSGYCSSWKSLVFWGLEFCWQFL